MTATAIRVSELSAWGLEYDVPEDPWKERALCAQTDPEMFFPEKGGSTREAKRICRGCEVKDECLDYALANEERFGIWGGFSERERRRLTRGERVELDAVPVGPDRRPNGHGSRCECYECHHTYGSQS